MNGFQGKEPGPQGLKPVINLGKLRGPEGPLFHGYAYIHELLPQPLKPCPPQKPFMRRVLSAKC
jgi:hypothetical protein